MKVITIFQIYLFQQNVPVSAIGHHHTENVPVSQEHCTINMYMLSNKTIIKQMYISVSQDHQL